MASPFPGMDPYLEDPVYWPDVRHSLATYLRDELRPLITPAYYAHVGERIYIEHVPGVMIPDVSVFRGKSDRGPAGSRARPQAGLVADPAEIVSAVELEIREPFITIADARRGGQIVTVIEILSPSNKALGSEGLSQYRRKQQEVLNSTSHLVEIDLHRGGTHTLAFVLEAMPPPRDWDYVVSVSRAEERQQFEVYRRTVRERLPRVAVPLAAPDPDVVVDLQLVLNRCYENGGYEQIIDYSSEPPTPLRERDVEWARELAAGELE